MPDIGRNFSPENTLGGNFVLPAADDSFAWARGRPTMRYDATGCPLRAETLLAALFEASSQILEDLNDRFFHR
jgi:hypothetical protein